MRFLIRVRNFPEVLQFHKPLVTDGTKGTNIHVLLQVEFDFITTVKN